jgi:dTDP-glucose 4,6-dehydratase
MTIAHMKKKVLITGGCGFIGSNFIRYFLKAHPHYEIVNIDKLTYAGNSRNIKDIDDPRHTFIKMDSQDRAGIEKIMRGVHYVVNFAAQTHVDRSIDNADDFLKTNYWGAYILLEAARRHKVERFLQISTDEVYGSITHGSFTERSPLAPSSPYSASKAAADLLAYSYYTTYGMNVVVARSTNNFGPHQYPEKFIPLFITNAIEGKKLPIYGDGKNVRDWIYVEDNCRALDLILHKGKTGEIYNIPAKNELKNIDVAHMILDKLKLPRDMVCYVKDRLGHDRRYSLDHTKIRRLGFRPRHSFKEGLGLTVRWYLDNKWWWEAIKRGAFRKYYEKHYTKR